MDIRQIKQFSRVSGVDRLPSSNEDGKFIKWNNSSGYYDYSFVGSGDIDVTYFTAFITAIFNDITTDDYLTAINRVGDSGQFTMESGTNLYLPLGALAWEDTVEATLTLPGDTKVLFDEADSIGGSANFTYNYTSDKLQLKAPIVFDKSEGTYKEGIKYVGNYSWSIGNSNTSTKLGTDNNTFGRNAGASLGASSSSNLVLGNFAGELMGATSVGSVLVGPYAGRYETANNKFFLDNTDHGDTATARTDSFLYADLDTERRLYIRDRLAVSKEGKFGHSGLVDASGEYGMYQMSAVSGGSPEWHDGYVWQPFANSTDTYLASGVYTGGNLTFTLSDASTVGPIDISGVNTTTFATSPSSPATGQTASSDYGYLQISNSAFTNDEGFTYVPGLRWGNTNSELLVPGAINISDLTADTLLNDNSIWSDGDHAYIKLNGTSIQMDNDAVVGESIDGLNVGGATYEWFKQRTDDDLEFRTMQTMPLGTYNLYDRMSMAYSTDGNAVYIGTTAERNRLETTIADETTEVQLDKAKVGETLHVRALKEGTGVTLTETENYILIDATGAGGGELNTASNLGAGLEFWAYKNGADLEFFTLDTTDLRVDLTQATDRVTDQENIVKLDLTLVGNNIAATSGLTYSGESFVSVSGPTGITPTFNFNTLVSNTIDIDSTTVAGELRLEVGSAAATGTNLGAGITVYSNGTAPDFEFKTFNTAGTHVDITANADGNTIDVDVDDLVTTFLGTGEQLFEINVDGWTIDQLGLAVEAASGLTIASSATDITIDQPILIPEFSFITSPSFTPGTPTTQGLLEFTTGYNEDVRDGSAVSTETMFELNVGDGLSYDSGTNTLSANVSTITGNSDHYLKDVDLVTTATEHTITFTVDNALGTDPISLTGDHPIVIPIPGSVIADYTDVTGATGDLGGVKVYPVTTIWENSGTESYLDLDEATGALSIPFKVVTYNDQNNLLDEDNAETGTTVNPLRTQARANIGAAYAEGSANLDFNTDNLTVNATSGVITAANTTETHTVGALTIDDTQITGTSESTWKGTTTNTTAIAQTAHNIVVTVDDYATGGAIYINNTSGATMFKFDVATGNLYVKGSVIADQDIEAFTDDVTV